LTRRERRLHLLEVGLHWPPETFLQWKFERLAAEGIRVTVASTVPRRKAGARVAGVELYRVPHWREPRALKLLGVVWEGLALLVRDHRRLATLVAAVRRPVWPSQARTPWPRTLGRLRLFLRLARLRPDVVHFEWERAAVHYLPLLEVWDCPMVVSCRGNVNAYARTPQHERWARGLPRVYSRAAAVQCVCEALRNEAVPYGLDRRKAWLIRAAVDPEFFRPVLSKNSERSPLRVISVGRLIWMKGYEYGLQAIRLLVDRGVPVRLDIIGDGEERARIVATVRDLALDREVRLSGPLTSQEVRDRLQRSDVLLQSSVTEGIPHTMLEGMACGLPVVATGCGGIPEAVADRREGLVVPPRDPGAIADALQALWQDAALRRALGEAGRARVLSNHTLTDQTEAFLALYEHVAGKHGARPSTDDR
jgi:colanic acid/amylovoran biosynthesis glycosyltransferase